MLAGYYFKEKFLNNNNIGAALASSGLTTNVLLTGDIDIETASVFANGSLDLTDKFTLNFGGRFAWEERGGDNSFGLFFTTPPNITLFSDVESFTQFTPTAGLEYRHNDDTLFYFTFSEGFKGGGFQGGQRTPILDPELITNYELGLKGAYFDNRLQVNISGFRYNITDMQVDRTAPAANNTFVAIFENAAEARATGVEFESQWAATDNLTFQGNFAYLDTQFVDYITDNPINAGVNLEQLAGNRLRQSPVWSASLRGEYTHELPNGGSLTFGADASYKGDQFYTEFNDPISGQEAYTLINMNLEYAPNDQISLNIGGRNITDEFVVSGAFVSSTGLTISGNNLAPATYGATLSYNF